MDDEVAYRETWETLSGIEGWMTEGQGRMLSERARRVRDHEAIVEIGSHHGRSTIVLAKAKRPGVRLVAVDPFDDPRWGGGKSSLERFQDNVQDAGVGGDVELFRGFGEEAAKTWDGSSVGVLYVDGAHDYPTVHGEIESWLPHVAVGGSVLFHDAFSSPGVTRAVLQASSAPGSSPM